MTPTPATDGRSRRYNDHNRRIRQAILDFIGTFSARYRMPPSIKDIRNGINEGLEQPLVSSPASISGHLNWLEEQGLLERGRRLEGDREVRLYRSVILSERYMNGEITLPD